MPIDLQRYPFRGAADNVDISPFTRLRDPGVEVSSTIFNWAADALGGNDTNIGLKPAAPVRGVVRVNEHDRTSFEDRVIRVSSVRPHNELLCRQNSACDRPLYHPNSSGSMS